MHSDKGERPAPPGSTRSAGRMRPRCRCGSSARGCGSSGGAAQRHSRYLQWFHPKPATSRSRGGRSARPPPRTGPRPGREGSPAPGSPSLGAPRRCSPATATTGAAVRSGLLLHTDLRAAARPGRRGCEGAAGGADSPAAEGDGGGRGAPGDSAPDTSPDTPPGSRRRTGERDRARGGPGCARQERCGSRAECCLPPAASHPPAAEPLLPVSAAPPLQLGAVPAGGLPTAERPLAAAAAPPLQVSIKVATRGRRPHSRRAPRRGSCPGPALRRGPARHARPLAGAGGAARPRRQGPPGADSRPDRQHYLRLEAPRSYK